MGGGATALDADCECLRLDGVMGMTIGDLVMGLVSPLAIAWASFGSTKAPTKGISCAVRVPSSSVK